MDPFVDWLQSEGVHRPHVVAWFLYGLAVTLINRRSQHPFTVVLGTALVVASVALMFYHLMTVEA